jgi:Na+-translocating ferredoxin:NAD+ oxidoreductase RnfC subunit
MAQDLADLVKQAGVVGAGGAGFPTHVKLASKVDTYIVNAAECEPLLYKDQELMERFPERMVQGLRLAMRSTGATHGVIAIKKKYKGAIAKLEPLLGSDVTFHLFDSFYPAGDEFIVVYDVTGRLIPGGGIPLHVGCAVNNVETLINVALAAEGKPVTRTALTIAGCVKEPVSVMVPLGVSIEECLKLAGGSTVANPAVLDGGAMMGKAVLEFSAPVTKTTGGFIVLPRDHTLIRRKTLSDDAKVTIARSACDQCSYCTEFCPRYLMGYAIEPHKVMRSVGFSGEAEAGWARLGLQCCECGVCDLYACPEDLPPKDMCIRSKRIWRERAVKLEPLQGRGVVHPMRDARRIPLSRLVPRLGLAGLDVHAPMVDVTWSPSRVRLMLQQHVGVPSVPVVKVGDAVREGHVVATVAEGKLGSNIHASIDGRVTRIDQTSIWVER